jgi:hypothetical protein
VRKLDGAQELPDSKLGYDLKPGHSSLTCGIRCRCSWRIDILGDFDGNRWLGSTEASHAAECI